jgi:hypothetical protein
MKESPSGQSPDLASDPAFDALERTLRRSGPSGAIEQLIEQLDQTGDYRSLLDALLLKARHDLNLPLIQAGGDMVHSLAARLQDTTAQQRDLPVLGPGHRGVKHS